jgi:hypothetical protein
MYQNLWGAKAHPGTVSGQAEFLTEFRNRKDSDSVFLKIPIPFVDLVEFGYFRRIFTYRSGISLMVK